MKVQMMNRLFLSFGILTMLSLTSCLNDDDVVNPIDQFNKETEAIDQYLDQNGLTAQIDTGGYDLRYIIHDQGTGAKPAADDITIVEITGTILGGSQFLDEDSVAIGFSSWIPAYQILLPYIKEGGSMTMFVPSYYGYGQNTAFDGKVAANSTLILNVKLKETLSMFDYEQLLIDQYIEENELTAEVDSVYGLRYIITEAGDGETYPTSSDVVNVDYSGRLLSTDKQFDSNVAVDFNLQNLIQGWRILMPYVSEGGEITMFIPSKYGYGTTGSGTIPGNATLIFEVRLNSVK